MSSTKRVKRDKTQRSYRLGYMQGLRGHAKENCPFFEMDQRSQWMAGWRIGHSSYVAGYRTAIDLLGGNN